MTYNFCLQKGELVKPNYNSVDLAEVELALTSQMVNIVHKSLKYAFVKISNLKSVSKLGLK